MLEEQLSLALLIVHDMPAIQRMYAMMLVFVIVVCYVDKTYYLTV